MNKHKIIAPRRNTYEVLMKNKYVSIAVDYIERGYLPGDLDTTGEQGYIHKEMKVELRRRRIFKLKKDIKNKKIDLKTLGKRGTVSRISMKFIKSLKSGRKKSETHDYFMNVEEQLFKTIYTSNNL